MGQIALKVDVDTLRGTLEGVPRLLKLFQKHQIHATFLFSLGPDHTGWALKRIFRPGFLKKVSRTSVVEHYGLKTLSYGVLLPAPDIGLRGKKVLQEVAQAQHEVGIHCWDHVLWQDHVRHQHPVWTQKQMQLAIERFIEIFSAPPQTHGAAGWQMNMTALEQIDAWQMSYASDGRAQSNLAPYRIKFDQGPSKHIQYPTTLPTFDELLGVDGLDGLGAVEKILQYTANNSSDQVFTLHAELEGQKLLPLFEKLITGWAKQGHHCVSLQVLHESWLANGQLQNLPVLPFTWGQTPNRSGDLMLMPASLHPNHEQI